MKRIILLFSILAASIAAFAQNTLEQVEMPSNPATSILGIQPSVTLSPKSVGALEAALINNFSSGNALTIPNDFSLEFSPYWFGRHGLKPSEIYTPEHPMLNAVRNLSVSIASTQNYLLGDSSASNAMGLGLRTSFFYPTTSDKETLNAFWKGSQKNLVVLQRLERLVSTYLTLTCRSGSCRQLDSMFEEIGPDMRKILLDNGYVKSDLEGIKWVDELLSQCRELPSIKDSEADFREELTVLLRDRLSISKHSEKIREYLANRDGVQIDLGLARLVNFPTNDFQYSLSPKFSFWASPRIHLNSVSRHFSLYLVWRYEKYDTEYYKRYFAGMNVYQNNNDLGGAIEYKYKTLGVKLETVMRSRYSEIVAGTDVNGNQLYRKEKSGDFQYLLSFQYGITQGVSLSYIIGNRFQPIQNPNATLVSQLGINIGLGLLGK